MVSLIQRLALGDEPMLSLNLNLLFKKGGNRGFCFLGSPLFVLKSARLFLATHRS